MTRIIAILTFCIWSFTSGAQEEMSIEDHFASLTESWLERSDLLHEYAGINHYCQSPEFRESVNSVLDGLHHYDSLLMEKMKDPVVALSLDYREQKKTIKDIAKLETGYSSKDFLEHMRETCKFRNEIEKNADRLRNDSGPESYDGKVLVLETDVQRYLNHIDKLVVKIESHLHYLYIVD